MQIRIIIVTLVVLLSMARILIAEGIKNPSDVRDDYHVFTELSDSILELPEMQKKSILLAFKPMPFSGNEVQDNIKMYKLIESGLNKGQNINIDFKQSEFENRFKSQAINNFKALEFLVSGNVKRCMGLNDFPPKKSWCNAFVIAKVLDEFRSRWGYPVVIDTAYLSPQYIKCVGDKRDVSYSEFRAVDFGSKYGKPKDWIQVLQEIHFEGLRFDELPNTNLVHIEFTQPPYLWVFTGKSKNGVFNSAFLKTDVPPVVGQKMERPKAATMNLHSSPPKIENGSWIWGERISYMDEGLIFVVANATYVRG